LNYYLNVNANTSVKMNDPGAQFQQKGFNYGFVEYDDPGAAERAMQTLNGRRVHQSVSLALRVMKIPPS